MTALENISQDFALPIGDDWIRTETIDTIRLPYDGSPVARVVRANADLVVRAVKAARGAAAVLENWTNFQRAELLDRIAAFLRRDHASFASAIQSRNGKAHLGGANGS